MNSNSPLARLLFAAGIALSVLACSGTPEEQDAPSRIVLGRLLESPLRTSDALVVSQGSAALDLGPDWYLPSASEPGSPALLRRGQGDLVFASQATDEELLLQGFVPGFLGEDQGLGLTLNGVDLGHHVLPPGGFGLRVPLPAGSLLRGPNTLELLVDRHGRPVDFREDQSDTRDFGLGLTALSVGAPGHSGPADLGLLGAGAELDPAHQTWASVYLPGEARLLLSGSAQGAGSLHVELRSEGAGQGTWTASVPVESGDWSWESLPIDLGRGHGTLSLSVDGDLAVDLGDAVLESKWGWPNILMISVDTLRADRVHGDTALELPVIGGLVEEGVSFPRTFAHVPMTLPSHTTLFSSRLPYDSGVFRNGQLVPGSTLFLAEWLQRSGYQTRSASAIGTLWAPQPGAGLDRGFQVYEDDVLDILPGSEARDRGLAVIEGLQPDSPYFLFLHFSDPHIPYNAHGTDSTTLSIDIDGVEEQLEIADMKSWTKLVDFEAGSHTIRMTCEADFVLRRFNAHRAEGDRRRLPTEVVAGKLFTPIRAVEIQLELEQSQQVELSGWLSDNPLLQEAVRRYDLEIAYTDRMLGEVLAVMEERGLLENTLIIFTSDHGEAFGEHGHVGHVEQLYDESLNVPLVIVPPAGSPLKPLLEQQTDQLVRLVDIAPTALDLMGLPPMPGAVGRSLLEASERVIYSEARPGEQYETVFALRDEQYLLLYSADEDRFKMFDLVQDPGQSEDVFPALGSRRADWQGLLRDIAAGRVGNTAESVGGEDMAERLGALGY